MARWALAAEQGQEPHEGAISGLEVGTRKEPCAQLSHPVLPPIPLCSLCCQMFFSGVPVGTLSAVLSELCFGRTPSKSLPPVPPCWCQQGRDSPAWKGKAGGSFPTHTVLTPICSVCLTQPFCPPSLSHPAQPQPGHFTSLLSVLLQWFAVGSWV